MLDPVVRPVAAPTGRTPRLTVEPLELHSFKSLLEESRDAQQLEAADQSAPAKAKDTANLLGPLSDLGSIDNESLRKLRFHA